MSLQTRLVLALLVTVPLFSLGAVVVHYTDLFRKWVYYFWSLGVGVVLAAGWLFKGLLGLVILVGVLAVVVALVLLASHLIPLIQAEIERRRERKGLSVSVTVGGEEESGEVDPATRKCPYCAELILSEAIKCRFCGELLVRRRSPNRNRGPLEHVAAAGALLVVCAVIYLAVVVSGEERGTNPSSFKMSDEPKRRPPVISMSHYDQVREGMMYPDVVEILGQEGEEMASSYTDGIPGAVPVSLKIISWRNRDGSNMNVTVQNGRVVAKAQLGLR